MKKIFVLIISLLTLVSCSKKYEDDFQAIRDKINEVERMLNELCDETNSQMETLKALVKAFETRDYITSIETLYVDGVEYGYEIHFLKGDPVTIVHGIDGRDGEDGEDGADGNPGQDGTHGSDGNSIKIGVKQGNDGCWYWTIDMGDGNGERWMRDADGNKVKASPEDGKDGEDGEDGKDGEDGQDGANGNPGKPGQDGEDGEDGADGKDGVTPRMKIEDGYWYLSLDGGKTWEKLGKATGDDGLPGPDAVTPEVMIESVRWDDNNAYFTLRSGDIITIPFKKPFGLQFEQTADILVAAGETVNVPYSIIGVDDETEIYCVCEGGWKAEVVEENFFSGHIAVRAPYPFAEGKVLVMAQNAADDLVMQSLTFKEIESTPVFLSYCDDPTQLDGWSEAICTADGTLFVGMPQNDEGYLLGVTKINTEEFAIVSLSPDGNIRQIYSHEGIAWISEGSNGTDLLILNKDGLTIDPIDEVANNPITKALDVSQTAGGLGLFANISSIIDCLPDLLKGGKLSIASFMLTEMDLLNNYIKLITGYDILGENKYVSNTLKVSGAVIDIAGLCISGVTGWGAVALVANLIATYIEAYDEAIKQFYGNCSAQISDIQVENATAYIKVQVSEWDSYRTSLEVGVAVGDFFHPSINEGSQIQSITHDGVYTFTVSGLNVGTTYHCRPFVADKSRESLWNNDLFNYINLDDFVNKVTGPLVRYGVDKSFSVPTPGVYTGDLEDVTDKSAIVGCLFYNVPMGASCGVEIDKSRRISADRDAISVNISGLEAATTYSYSAYVSYQGHTYYGATKELTTDLPDVSGTWTVVETSINGGSTNSYSVTLKKDGTVSISKDTYYAYSSWSRTKTGLSVSWGYTTGNSSYWSSTSTDLSIKFDDPQNPTSGEGTASTTNANSTVGGFAPRVYATIKMSR